MKSQFLLCFLVSMPTLNMAMAPLITTPSKSVLQERFNRDENSHHFAEKTNIAEKLAEKKLAPVGVYINLKQALCDFSENLQKQETSGKYFKQMADKTRTMLQIWTTCILEDHPDAIKKLKKMELIK